MRTRLLVSVNVALLVCAIAAVVIALVLTGAFASVKKSNETISVTGSAKEPIEADLVQWTLSVRGQARTPQLATRRALGRVQRVHAFLVRGGLPPHDIVLPPFEREDYRRRVDKKHSVTIVVITQPLQIASTSIDVVEGLARRIAKLEARGIDISVSPLAYISTQLAQAKVEALTQATADAARRARIIVGGLGGKVGRIRRAELGVYQVTPRYSTDVSNDGISDTSSRQKDVTAVINVTVDIRR
jgi:hypothetical protein